MTTEYIGRSQKRIPAYQDMDWHIPLNENFKIDAAIANNFTGDKSYIDGFVATDSGLNVLNITEGNYSNAGAVQYIPGNSFTIETGTDAFIYVDADNVLKTSVAWPLSPLMFLFFVSNKEGVLKISEVMREEKTTGGGLEWSVSTANLTTESDKGYLIDTTTAEKTVTLHPAPEVGDSIAVADLKGNFQINRVLINRNNMLIQGEEKDLILDVKNQRITLVYSGATDGWVITDLEPNSSQFEYMPYAVMHVQDQKPQGTLGGASIAGIQTRTLNTVLQNEIAGASLNANQITLPPGEYWIEGSVPAYNTDRNILRLYSVTNSSYIAQGTSEYSANSAATVNSRLQTKLSLTETTVIEVRHYTEIVRVNNGIGVAAFSGTEVYTNLKITKIGNNYAPKPILLASRLQSMAGVDTTGGVSGLNISKTGANQISITPGYCLDSSLEIPLVITSTLNLAIPEVANTLYHVAIVRLASNNMVTVKTYLSEIAISEDADINAFRWIGYVRTNASSSIVGFNMSGDMLIFHKASENHIASSIGTVATTINHSSILPVSKIREIMYGGDNAAGAVLYIVDGVGNVIVYIVSTAAISDTGFDAWGRNTNSSAQYIPFNPDYRFVTNVAAVNLLCHGVRIWR